MWRAQGLANPESAALSADRTFLYVTNVNGDGAAKDGNGFIARVGLDGRMLDRDWARGLNAPKGIMLRGGSLYVADIDEMVVIDAASGAVTRRVAAPGALFLNDLAFAPDGRVLIADSQNARIYAHPLRHGGSLGRGRAPRLHQWPVCGARPAHRDDHGGAAARDRLPVAFDQRPRGGAWRRGRHRAARPWQLPGE